jgi:ATP-binding cassette subfamily B protein
MLWKVIQGNLMLGDLALFYQAFQRGQVLMSTLFENLGDIYSDSLFLSDLFEFLALKPQVTDPTQPAPIPVRLKEGIRFEEVTFRYPDSQGAALRNFNLTIPRESIVAIVGANGAGKSTLMKLLCRFYDPDSGRILMDGVDLRMFSLRELHRQITVLFQEPVNYQGTFRENIALGDLSAANDPRQIELAARAAGADKVVDGLAQGYETILGKWFKGGTDLSVGEWAEHDWLQRFRGLAASQTTLIITHRFTTAMYADRIHVMEEGRIVESGNHAELLALGGRYAQSWHAQIQTAYCNADQLFIPPENIRESQADGSRKDKVFVR